MCGWADTEEIDVYLAPANKEFSQTDESCSQENSLLHKMTGMPRNGCADTEEIDVYLAPSNQELF